MGLDQTILRNGGDVDRGIIVLGFMLHCSDWPLVELSHFIAGNQMYELHSGFICSKCCWAYIFMPDPGLFYILYYSNICQPSCLYVHK